MNAMFNLISLLVIIGVGLFAYAQYKDDPEFDAKIMYYVNNIITVARDEYEDWRRDAKDAADNAGRNGGNMLRDAAEQLRR